jgi:hypothetical protein
VTALHAVKHGSRKGLARQILRVFQGGKTPKPDVYKLGGPSTQYIYIRVHRFLDFLKKLENLDQETEAQLDYEEFFYDRHFLFILPFSDSLSVLNFANRTNRSAEGLFWILQYIGFK